jgi:hypothetical protein
MRTAAYGLVALGLRALLAGALAAGGGWVAPTGADDGGGDAAPPPPGTPDAASPIGTDDAAPPPANVPDAAPIVAGRGATVPWLEYEAEDGVTNAAIVGPSRALGTIAGEASGRRVVVLDANGEFVEWTARAAANAIVVRATLPDAPAGGGIDAGLGLYVDGVRRATLALSSRHSWIYGGDEQQFNAPSAGAPRRIYEEAHLLLGFTIAAGATVRLQKDAGDDAPSYGIDLVDLELVGDPLPRPPGFIDVTEAGHPWAPAVPDDGQPDDEAIRRSLDEVAQGHASGVFIPRGVFEQTDKLVVGAHTTVAGAGMWYSVLHNADLDEDPGWGKTGFIMNGDDAHFRDLAVFGNTDGLRNQGGKAWANSAYSGATIENVWVENVQCAYWVGGNPESTGLVIRHSRFRDTGADAINLCNGTRDSVVEHNHARNTGDDAFAIWSATDLYPHPDTHNVIRHCTAQITWRAAAFAIYGGADNRIEDSVAYDTLTYPGLTVSSQYDPFPLESATVDGLTLVRTGGTYWGGQEFGAIWVLAAQSPTAGITIRNVDVIDPSYSGLHVQGLGGEFTSMSFENIRITHPTTAGVRIQAGAKGAATFKNVTVEGSATPLADESGGAFTIHDAGGNSF